MNLLVISLLFLRMAAPQTDTIKTPMVTLAKKAGKDCCRRPFRSLSDMTKIMAQVVLYHKPAPLP